jgi:acetyl esterase/lipase
MKAPQTFSYTASGKDPRQALDLYPADDATRTIVFVHGGAWISDDKKDYEGLARFFASRGVSTINVNYRLSGKESSVRHPDHVQDCAEAMRWIAREAASRGAPGPYYLMGFSAGAFLAASLALNSSLKVPLDQVAGYIGIEGIYDLRQLVETYPSYRDWFVSLAFGPDEKTWEEASPTRMPLRKSAPWLLVHSPGDELVDFAQCDRFAEQLDAAGTPVRCYSGGSKKHYEVIQSVGLPGDELTAEILRFVSDSRDRSRDC